MPTVLSAEQLECDLSVRDLTDPAEGPHAIQLVTATAARALAARWGCQVRWCRGERLVPVADNYDLLGYDPADVTREARYTRYVTARQMLRSHSSALIPPALRALAAEPAGDVLLVCPALVYRRDSIDRLHTGTPHQLDLWRVTRREPAMTHADLREMIAVLLGALLPGARHRLEPRTHPYTVDGRQIDVRHGDDWVEVGECGLAHPQVLRNAGLDGTHSGLALGADAARVESVEIAHRTPCAALPGQARSRLGAADGQDNLLVRVVLRDLDRTLTDADANLLRDRIYAAIHQGSEHQWAGVGPPPHR